METAQGNMLARNLHWLLLAMAVVAVAASVYKYYVAKDYLFTIEAPCDQGAETCYVRECADGECPPNELAEYRLFELPASSFASCEDNSCLNVCPSEEYGCREIACEENDETMCSTPQDEAEELILEAERIES